MAKLFQCVLCARWAGEGNHLPSANRDARSGETPCDNFVCDRCQEEARNEARDRQERLSKSGPMPLKIESRQGRKI